MAEAASAVPSDELLEWPKKDKRRLLHAVYRVGDLDRTIKYYACIAFDILFWCANSIVDVGISFVCFPILPGFIQSVLG